MSILKTQQHQHGCQVVYLTLATPFANLCLSFLDEHSCLSQMASNFSKVVNCWNYTAIP